MATTYDNWRFKSQRVREEHVEGHYASADATLICSGPPLITGTATITGSGADQKTTYATSVYPIGYLENFTLQQSKQLQRLWEIGSYRSYFIPGRVIGSISLGRIFYHGYSLMRVLYPFLGEQTGAIEINGGSGAGTLANADTFMVNEADNIPLAPAGISADLLPKARVSPGANKFWLNLAADVFSQPHGMAMFFKDSSEQDIGASYIENNYIQGHQITIAAGNILLMEGVSLQYDRLVPIKMNSKPVSG